MSPISTTHKLLLQESICQADSMNAPNFRKPGFLTSGLLSLQSSWRLQQFLPGFVSDRPIENAVCWSLAGWMSKFSELKSEPSQSRVRRILLKVGRSRGKSWNKCRYTVTKSSKNSKNMFGAWIQMSKQVTILSVQVQLPRRPSTTKLNWHWWFLTPWEWRHLGQLVLLTNR